MDLNYQKEKLRMCNKCCSNLYLKIGENKKLQDQNAVLQDQLKFLNNLLNLKYKELSENEQYLRSAENALVQKEAAIQELQTMLKKFIAKYGQLVPKDIEQQEIDEPSENYQVNIRIDELQKELKEKDQELQRRKSIIEERNLAVTRLKLLMQEFLIKYKNLNIKCNHIIEDEKSIQMVEALEEKYYNSTPEHIIWHFTK